VATPATTADEEDDGVDEPVDVDLLIAQLTSLGFSQAAAARALAANVRSETLHGHAAAARVDGCCGCFLGLPARQRGNFEKAFDALKREHPEVKVSAAAAPKPASAESVPTSAPATASAAAGAVAQPPKAPKREPVEQLLISFDDDEEPTPSPLAPGPAAAQVLQLGAMVQGAAPPCLGTGLFWSAHPLGSAPVAHLYYCRPLQTAL